MHICGAKSQFNTEDNCGAGMTFSDFWDQKFAVQGQYFFTRVISQRIGAVLAYLAWRIGLRPNSVTLTGLVTMLAASVTLACASTKPALLPTSLLLYQLGFGLDCADGQLARATKRTSAYGAWLDIAADHMRQVSILLALGTHFVAQSTISLPLCFGALLVIGSGMAIYLHTVTVLRSGTYQPHGLTGLREQIKKAVMGVSDTPLFLLMICLLIPWPLLLLCYLYAVGLLYLAQAVMLAIFRIGPQVSA
jgi:phosphatidylglycerophosphate synthase